MPMANRSEEERKETFSLSDDGGADVVASEASERNEYTSGKMFQMEGASLEFSDYIPYGGYTIHVSMASGSPIVQYWDCIFPDDEVPEADAFIELAPYVNRQEWKRNDLMELYCENCRWGVRWENEVVEELEGDQLDCPVCGQRREALASEFGGDDDE